LTSLVACETLQRRIRQARRERQLAAILVADVFGYGRLMGADEEGSLA
jgi:hypothetical protein